MSPRRNFKTTGRWHRKSGRTEQSGYQFKKTAPSRPECPVKHTSHSRKKSIEASTQGVEENNKRYQKNPQLYRTRQIEKNQNKYE
jgi:hypothetical protein